MKAAAISAAAPGSRATAVPKRVRQITAAASRPISASMSTGAPGPSAAHAARCSATTAVITGASAASRPRCVTAATTRRRDRQFSPSETKSPSPISGSSAWRSCGLLRSKASFSVTKAACAVSGLLQTRIRRASSRVAKIGSSKCFSCQTESMSRRKRRSSSSGGSRPVRRGG